MHNESIAHVFRLNAPFLVAQFSRDIASLDEDACFYLRDVGIGTDPKLFEEKNARIVSVLPTGRYKGCLEVQHWMRSVRNRYVRFLLSWFWLELRIKSIRLIWSGPRCWVIHGVPFSFVTMILMRLMGKRVVLIHWGGRSLIGRRYEKWLCHLHLKLYRHIFCLMSPEVVYYRKCFPKASITCLPYCTSKYRQQERSLYENAQGEPLRVFILGNSTWNRTGYEDLLKRVPCNSWDRVICMLNYGMSHDKEATDAFVRANVEKFGCTFYAWRDIVPYTEYCRIMLESPYYFCPAKTQSGLGAIYASISMGKTVFLQGDNFAWLTEMGIKVYDIEKIEDFSYEGISSFRLTADEVVKNCDMLFSFFTSTYNPEVWLRNIKIALGLESGDFTSEGRI